MFWSNKSKLKRAIKSAGLRKCKSEAEAETKLAKKLRERGFAIEQQVHKDGQRADIVACGIPIELKYQPSTTEMDRLVGQVGRYKRNWGDVIVVLVNGTKDDCEQLKLYVKGVTVLRGM